MPHESGQRIGSDNGLPTLGYCQLHPKEQTSVKLLTTYIKKKKNFSSTKIHLKISSAKWRPFCPGRDELTHVVIVWFSGVSCSLYPVAVFAQISMTVAKRILSLMKSNGPLTRYVKLRVVHAPGMPGTFFPPTRVSDQAMHHGTYVTHVMYAGIANWWFPLKSVAGKTFPAFPAHAQPAFYGSGKRPVAITKASHLQIRDGEC